MLEGKLCMLSHNTLRHILNLYIMVVRQGFTFKKLDIGTYENEGTGSPLFRHICDR